MKSFRVIVLSAVLAGAIGGAVSTVAQAVRVTPLIRAAEIYEAAARAVPNPRAGQSTGGDHLHDNKSDKSDQDRMPVLERLLQISFATLTANTLAGIGFALLITAAMALHGRPGWYTGLLWGLGGFASFTLAPAAGLPPELPGAAAADLFDRQVWWIGTAFATAGGLGLIFLGRRLGWAALGAVLIVAPHVVGAPAAPGPGVGLPDDLVVSFGIASIVTNFMFWATLGIASGILYERLSPDGNAEF